MLDPFFEELRQRGLALRPEGWRPEIAAIRLGMARETETLDLGPAMQLVRDHAVPTRGGRITVRELSPDGTRGIIVFVHGGGWATGRIEDFDSLARAIAAATQCTVLVLDYRLAPEHPHPAGLEDVMDCLLWAQDLARERQLPLLGAGDSAGANLLLAATLELGDRLHLRHISALYPVTDCDEDTGSYREHGQGLLFTAAAMRMFFEAYAPQEKWTDPTISILRHAGIAALPPVLVMTCSHDLLRDDGLKQVEALKARGMSVEHADIDGVPHGFLRYHAQSALARAALERISQAVARALA